MPANPRSLALGRAYRDGADRTWRATNQAVLALLAGIDTADIGGSFRAVLPNIGAVIRLGQGRAQDLSVAYFRRLAELETGRAAGREPADLVGKTVDGRPIGVALAATPAKVVMGLRRGWSTTKALTFARFAFTRTTQTTVMDTARAELRNQMKSPGVVGWRWRSRGTCGACLALDDGSVRGSGEFMRAHPNCECLPEPGFDVEERIQPETGRERFMGLPKAEQDALLGHEKAELIRTGAIAWSQLVKTEQHKEWRPSITEAPLEQLRKRGSPAA